MEPTKQKESRDAARRALAALRAQHQELRTKLAALNDRNKYTPLYATEQSRTLRDEYSTRATGYLAAGIDGALADALATQPSRLETCAPNGSDRKPSILVPLGTTDADIRPAERAMVTLLNDLAEDTAARRWLGRAQRLSTVDLQREFDAALSRSQWAIAATLLDEATARQQRASNPALPEAELAAAAPDRLAALEMHRAIEEATMPEVQEAEELHAELREVREWLDDAVRSIATGDDDPGVRAEIIADVRRDGGDNDAVRAALAAAERQAGAWDRPGARSLIRPTHSLTPRIRSMKRRTTARRSCRTSDRLRSMTGGLIGRLPWMPLRPSRIRLPASAGWRNARRRRGLIVPSSTRNQ